MSPTRFQYPSPSFQPYWESGRGKLQLSQLEETPSLTAIEELAPRYFEVDTLADAVVRETYAVLGFPEATKLLEKAFTADFPREKYPHTAQLIAEMEVVPEWFDRTLLDFGSMLCQRSGSKGLMVLRNYCLMGGYESAAINKPLVYTGALKKGAAKRLRETTEFWIQVVGPDAYEQKIMHRYALQTRLMHAYSRYMIETQTDWNKELWGRPLNQWDMLATNLGFSLVYLDGLRALGFAPTPQEITGLFHFWRYMGVLLGIPADLLPVTESEAIHSLYLWTMNQPAADADTVSLAQALMEEPIHADYPRFMWQKRMVRKIHLGYNAYFLGENSCKNLGLPYAPTRFFIRNQVKRQLRREMYTLSSSVQYLRSVNRNRKTQERIVKRFFKLKGKLA